ncbi:MAG: nickel-responsive transcriptional regulator NikR [Thermoplasmata archaeon]|nr:nickel-responsive transcriptional regulator NikR [Thermoplasmata archaeon]
MGKIRRIGVSIEPGLLKNLDKYVRSKEYPSRSEAIRDLVSDRLSQERLQNPDEISVGSIMILYDHNARGLSDKLTDFQHEEGHHGLIISATHIHIDEDICLEILACKGRAGSIKALAEKISAIKGVKHGELTMRSMSGISEPSHAHPHRH